MKKFVAALIFCCFLADAAQALTINLNNNVNEVIYVALIYYDVNVDDWMKDAWYRVDAGQTRVLNKPAAIGTIYYYGRNSNHNRTWTLPNNNPRAHTDDIVNERMYLRSRDTPRGNGYRFVNFIEFEFDSSTVNLNFNR